MDETESAQIRVGSAAPSQVITDAADAHRSRATMRLVMRGLREGWDIKPESLRELPDIAVAIAKSGESETVKLRAIELIATLRRDNVNALEKIDRIDRLDAGESTENQSHKIEVRHVNLIDGTHTD